MDMKEEIMNDAIDDAMEDEGDEEERYQAILCIYINSVCKLLDLQSSRFEIVDKICCKICIFYVCIHILTFYFPTVIL